MATNKPAVEEPPEAVPIPLAAVSLKLPPFWQNDPTLWFAQVEAQFQTRGITAQATKFAHIVGCLQPDVAQEVRDLLIDPPQSHPFDVLRLELIRRTSASEQKKLHQLLIAEELGDRKPSQLLRRMKQLLGDNKLEERILKQLFLQRLPSNVQLILASTSDTMPITQLADLADKIVEVVIPPVGPVMSALATPSASPPSTIDISAPPASVHTVPPPSSDIQNLQAQVNQLTLQVQQLSTHMLGAIQSREGSSRSRHRDASHERAPSRSSSTQRHSAGECWYHWRFGSLARKCIPPCTFQPAAASHPGNEKASR